MSETVTFHSQLPFSEFLSTDTTEIVDSNTYRDRQWRKLSKQQNFGSNINKLILPVNIDYANFLVLTQVEAGAEFTPHTHEEPMFRFIIDGSFELNGKPYSKGDWVFVPAGVPYDMKSSTGYTTMSGYGMACTGGVGTD